MLVLGGRRNSFRYAVPLAAIVVALARESLTPGISWSPYYKIEVIERSATQHTDQIIANGVPHQGIAPLATLMRPASPYEQPYDETPKNPHKRVLVIGAGNGNDVEEMRTIRQSGALS